jgi:putative hydrolases of HD superfamily
MQKLDIQELIAFMQTLHAFQAIERVMPVPNKERSENDAEHSYLLAMMTWYVIDTYKLPLDRDKAIRYALAHDLPELHAGDTYLFTTDEALLSTKKEREAAARKKLLEELPTVPDIHEAMEAYEHQTDEEAVFVRALDKILPIITNYVQDGRGWKQEGVSLPQLKEVKLRTTKRCPEVHDAVQQLFKLIEDDIDRFFEKDMR